MKLYVSFLLSLILLAAASAQVCAQHRKLTVILLRHAEKDLTLEDAPNPELSAEGERRAQRLAFAVEKYQPDVIYSTDYLRTRATVRPLARKHRMMTLVYDGRDLKRLNDLILSGKFKRVLIVGHNNTTPALVNMFLNEDKYKPLAENEYDKIWIVKIKRNRGKPNKVREKIITY